MRRWLGLRKVVVTAFAIAAFALTATTLYINIDVRPRLVLIPEPMEGKLVHGFSPDGRWLVARSFERLNGDRQFHCVIQIWNSVTGREQWRVSFEFPVSEEQGVFPQHPEFSPDSRFLVIWWSNHLDGRQTMTLLDTMTGKTRTFQCDQVDFSPDGQFLAIWHRYGNKLSTITLLNLANGNERTMQVRGLCFSPNGRQMAVSAELGDYGPQVVKLLDTASGTEIARVAKSALGHQDWNAFSSIEFSPDGRMLAYENDSAVHLSRKVRRRLRGRHWERVLTLWDIKEQKPGLRIRADYLTYKFAPTGRTLAVSSTKDGKQSICLWDTTTAGQMGDFEMRADVDFGQIVFSADESTVGSDDGAQSCITTWDLRKQKIIRHFDGYLRPKAFQYFELLEYPDKSSLPRFIFQRSNRPGNEIKVWDLVTGHEVISLASLVAGRTPPISNSWYTFTPDAKLLVLCQSGTSQTNWLEERLAKWVPFVPPPESEFRHGIQCLSLPDCYQFPPLPGCREWSKITRDSRTLASLCDDGTIKLWDLPPRKPLGLILAWSSVPAALVLLFGWWRGRGLRGIIDNAGGKS